VTSASRQLTDVCVTELGCQEKLRKLLVKTHHEALDSARNGGLLSRQYRYALTVITLRDHSGRRRNLYSASIRFGVIRIADELGRMPHRILRRDTHPGGEINEILRIGDNGLRGLAGMAGKTTHRRPSDWCVIIAANRVQP
jgi:hypothetical protein